MAGKLTSNLRNGWLEDGKFPIESLSRFRGLFRHVSFQYLSSPKNPWRNIGPSIVALIGISMISSSMMIFPVGKMKFPYSTLGASLECIDLTSVGRKEISKIS